MEDHDVMLQRKYYAATAHRYDASHCARRDEHYFALTFLAAALDYLGARSMLDIGSGTGRAIRYIKEVRPNIRILGVEPVKELRDIAYREGVRREDLIDGDAVRLPFDDGEFDVCCEFGVLHHLRAPSAAVDEMLRVAKKAVFISDSNNFGQGGAVVRGLKQLINALGLWGVADFVKTRGKGYTVSDGDGVSYSYSVFNDFQRLKQTCRTYVLNTSDAGMNPYRSAGHVALLAVKRDSDAEIS